MQRPRPSLGCRGRVNEAPTHVDCSRPPARPRHAAGGKPLTRRRPPQPSTTNLDSSFSPSLALDFFNFVRNQMETTTTSVGALRRFAGSCHYSSVANDSSQPSCSAERGTSTTTPTCSFQHRDVKVTQRETTKRFS